jgi:fatty-acyl-CoA synthase
MTLGNIVGRQALLNPDKVALVDTLNGSRRITYAQWSNSINQTANWLSQGLAVQKGERVAVLALNSVEYLDIWLACGRIGAILQNLNWRLTAEELSNLTADAEPTVLIYGPDFLNIVPSLRRTTSIRHFVALAAKERPEDTAFSERETVQPVRQREVPWIGMTPGLSATRVEQPACPKGLC